EADDGVVAHRGVGVDLDGGDHLLGIVTVELQVGDLPDAHAVEKYARAGAQPAHRALEHDMVAGADLRLTDRPEPVHEGKARDQHAEREEADQDVVCFAFHSLTLPRFTSVHARAPYRRPATACRGNTLLPKGDRTRASRPLDPRQSPCRPIAPRCG